MTVKQPLVVVADVFVGLAKGVPQFSAKNSSGKVQYLASSLSEICA